MGTQKKKEVMLRFARCAVQYREPTISFGIWNFMRNNMKVMTFSLPMSWENLPSFLSILWMSVEKMG